VLGAWPRQHRTDDGPTGGPGGSALCGECDRNRNFEADLGALDAADGSLDGMIDW
jgi:hypothetical protein